MWRDDLTVEAGPVQGQVWLSQQTLSRVMQDQSDLPFWDRAPCPPALVPLLIDPAEDTRIYAVIDGAKRKALRGTNDLPLWQDSLLAEPLLQIAGAPQENGPWLVDLSADPAEGRRFLSGFFADADAPLAGILLKSTAGRDELRSHLRGLMRVRRAGAPDEIFLRWWDPATAIALLGAATARADIDRLCFTRNGTPLVWLAAAPGYEMRILAPTAAPEQTGLARPVLQLDPAQEAALKGTVWTALQATLGQWLAASYPELGLTTAEARARAGAHLVTVGRSYGFVLKDEFSYLGHVMVWLGGWFHQTGAFPALDRILVSREMRRQKPMRPALQADWAGSWLKPLAGARDALLGGAGIGPALTDAEASALLSRHLAPTDAAKVLNFYWFAARDAQARGLPSDLLAFVAFASLFLGYRWFDDPFRQNAPQTERDWHETCRITASRLKEFRHG